MSVYQNNFTSFPGKTVVTDSEIDVVTSDSLKLHPEYKILPSNAPCTDCYEDLDKRTLSSRYFIKTGTNGREILSQSGFTNLHYLKNGFLRSIDHKLTPKPGFPGVYFAPDQYVSTEINTSSKETRIQNGEEALVFNKNLELYEVKQTGQKILIATSSWNNHTAGEDGILVNDLFPGVDMEIIARMNGLKTNYIIKDSTIFTLISQGSSLLIKDNPIIPSSYTTDLSYSTLTPDGGYIGDVIFKGTGDNSFTFSPAIAYDNSGDRSRTEFLPYYIAPGEISIGIPSSLLMNPDLVLPLTIDPLVSGNNSLAQSSITGSMYNSSCNFINSCSYNVSVTVPAAITITDIRSSFSYLANGSCLKDDGAMDFLYSSCTSPPAGFFWRCIDGAPGTCVGNDISLFNHLSSCIPSPQCASYSMPFTLRLYRSCFGNTTGSCSPNCISAASGWTMVVEGRTLEEVAPLSSSLTDTLCAGSTTELSVYPGFGVPPYTYLWNSGASSQTIYVSPTADTLYTCQITDACGNSFTSSINLIVLNSILSPAPSFSVSLNPASANPCPVTVTVTDNTSSTWGGGTKDYYWSFPGATTISPATLSGSTTTPPYTSDPSGTYTLTYNTGGTFTLSMQVVSSGQCNSAAQTIAICTLPVELLEFNAERINEKVYLTWTTLSEENNQKYILEKSVDAENFKPFHETKGAGYSNERRDYNATDNNPGNDRIYYRLKQIDFDGNYSFSEIIEVKGTNLSEIKFYPNPVKENGTLSFNLINSGEVVVRIFNYTGQKVLEKTGSGRVGQNEMILQTGSLPDGIYSIQLSESTTIHSIVLIKN